MANNKTSFRFYRIEYPDRGVTIESVLEAESMAGEPHVLTADFGGRKYRFYSLEYDNVRKVWFGEIGLIDMKLTRHWATPTGQSYSPFVLEQNQGIADPAAFLYWPERQVLLIQYVHTGARVGRWVDLLQSMSGDIDAKAYPVMDEEKMSREGAFDEYTKFEIGYAGRMSPEHYDDLSTKAAFKVADEFGSNRTTIVMSLGHKDAESLKGGRVRALIDAWRAGKFGDQLTKLKLTGRRTDGQNPDGSTQISEEIDLLKHQLREDSDLSVDENRTVPYALRQAEIQRIFGRKRGVLMNTLNARE